MLLIQPRLSNRANGGSFQVQELRTQGQVNEQVEAQAKQIVDSALVLLWKWMSDADNNVYVDSHCEQSPCDTDVLFIWTALRWCSGSCMNISTR